MRDKANCLVCGEPPRIVDNGERFEMECMNYACHTQPHVLATREQYGEDYRQLAEEAWDQRGWQILRERGLTKPVTTL